MNPSIGDRAPVQTPAIVSREEWRQTLRAHLAQEKQLTQLRDQLAASRRALPWTRIDKNYVFDGPDGHKTLADLFAGRSQLVLKHFMFGPGWREGCVGCSFEADHIEATLVHLEHHDVSVAAISRAPWAEIAPFKTRMGWHFNWLSSFDSDFNYDFDVSFTPAQMAAGTAVYNFVEQALESDEMSGISVFYRDRDGAIFHTFSAFGRGAEELLGTYILLDLTPGGRNENGPNGNLTDWVRHHDRYGDGGFVDGGGRYRDGAPAGCCDH